MSLHLNTIILTCEGNTEEGVLKDLINRKKLSLKKIGVDETNLRDINMEVVHPGYISTWFNTNNEYYDVIIFLLDKDVEREVNRANSLAIHAKRMGIKFIPVYQNPHMETFFAACFAEYTINDSLETRDLKMSAEAFLLEKFGWSNKKHLKKLTIKIILDKGGCTKNAHRYKERFDILEWLI